MGKILSIVSMAFFMSCIPAHEGVIKNKRWRMVKQVTVTQDKAGNSTSEKVKDFSIMDSLYFDTDDKLSIVSYGSAVQYQYKIKDSVLTYWPQKEVQKINEYRIAVSTKDSLVLTRTEVWGSESPLKITASFHLSAIKK